MANRWHVCSFTTYSDLTIGGADGKEYRFEFSRQFGPLMIGKRGQTVDAMPPLRSSFWRALELWLAQGEQITDGRCVYTIPVEPQFVRLVGRHVVEVPPGRDPEDVRREGFEKMGIPPPSASSASAEADKEQ